MGGGDVYGAVSERGKGGVESDLGTVHDQYRRWKMGGAATAWRTGSNRCRLSRSRSSSFCSDLRGGGLDAGVVRRLHAAAAHDRDEDRADDDHEEAADGDPPM